jgi:hypothetical protein
MVPLSEDATQTVLYLAHYVMVCHRALAFRAISIVGVLLLPLTSSSMLGRKRCVAYALRELGGLDMNDAMSQLAQRAGRKPARAGAPPLRRPGGTSMRRQDSRCSSAETAA